ncbi:AAA family ATPase [Georgenia sp. SYP-B2076]|uniref:AAA family ATPase n=1 Tax=Georgenia sp. SYP-B2076 TaxID=2495881 RepID=UPI000F8DF23D|nr:AAA family ATPase [Georgenia sp. SYP-B2076]
MAVRRNPFKPTAGALPPLLVGRQDVIDEFVESIEDGPGAPGRITIFTGPRGVGKTVMLTEVADQVRQLGWVTISDAATPGLVARMTHALTRRVDELGDKPTRPMTGFTLPGVGGGLTFAPPPEVVVDFRGQLGKLLDLLEPHGTGLMLAVDEVHRKSIDDLRALATTYQLLTSEGRNVALAMAGLPSSVSDLLSDDILTFLRRANREVLDDVPLGEVRDALGKTVTDEGRTITDDALEEATAATGGYPFMIQLVGYHVWRKADGDVIDLAAVRAGVPAARKRLGSTVHETALADLSAVDRTYLLAMSHDDGPSRTGEVAKRMDVTPFYASTYRARLIDAGIIEAVDHGYVDFAIPYLREYLREHAARYEMAARHRKR